MAELKFDRIFLKFETVPSNYITKLSTYVRHKYEIFENFGAMLLFTFSNFRKVCLKYLICTMYDIRMNR